MSSKSFNRKEENLQVLTISYRWQSLRLMRYQTLKKTPRFFSRRLWLHRSVSNNCSQSPSDQQHTRIIWARIESGEEAGPHSVLNTSNAYWHHGSCCIA